VMVGDVDFKESKEVAGMITPVPGGTGPMTNIMLMKNVITAARRQAG
jgi:methylenetetrahydrofolate dehydrogenase (NADP+)/methenyltetrahydrofolate cyclohydrolase